MLKLSAHQFIGISIEIENLILSHDFSCEQLKEVQLLIGDPAPNGDISFDVTYPKGMIQPQTS